MYGKKIRLDSNFCILFSFCLIILISILLEPNNVDGFGYYLYPLMAFIFSFLISIQPDKDRILHVYLLKISILILCFSVIAEPFLLLNDAEFLNNGLRLAGFSINPNYLPYQIISMLICINYIQGSVSKKLLLFSSIFILLSFSRSGIAFFIIYLFLSNSLPIINMQSSLLFLKRYKYLLPIILGVIIFYTKDTDFIDFLSKLNIDRINPFNQQEQLSVDSSRLDILSEYIYLINDSPIKGHGITEGMSQDIRAHNTFLNLWFELGLVGLLIHVVFIIAILVRSYLVDKSYILFLFIFWYSFFINNIYVLAHTWLLIGIFLGIKPKDVANEN
jgi:O-antigen ligase